MPTRITRVLPDGHLRAMHYNHPVFDRGFA
jgi:hypothetical protein